MRPRFLLDENLSPDITDELKRLDASIEILRVGDAGVPPLSTLDPDILLWIEANNYILVTGNRTSMPGHLVDHFALGKSHPGILYIRPRTKLGQLIAALHLVWGASEMEEYYNKTDFIPF
jgi:Domain of unknown function (DUF5615)